MMSTKFQGSQVKQLAVISLLTLLAVTPVFSQARAVRIEVPYEFTVGSKVLPAGTYTFSLSANDQGWVEVHSEGKAETRARVVTRLGGPSEFQDGSLVFDKTGTTRILSEVWIPGTDGILVHATPKGHTHDIVMSYSGGDTSLSGKAAFDRTCSRCHGPDGAGNPRADKFFNTTIPRLNSAVVQSKSDAELKEIITTGRRGMPPVETDEGGFRHRLPPAQVDSLIAYVRTLKK